MPVQLLDRPVAEWPCALAIFLAIAFVVPILRKFIRRKCPITHPPDRSWRGLLGDLNNCWFRISTLTIAIAAAALPLEPEPKLLLFLKFALVLILTIQAARLVPVLVDWGIQRLASTRTGEPPSSSTISTLTGLRWIVLFAAYAVILVLALQNVGIEVTALVAGLGIGGVAIALALQSILGDLFASLTIALDKPFVVGDFIVVGNEMGTIENVGLKTTRVRSLSGEQLVFANSDLLASRIRNFKRMTERRVVFGFGVLYSTSPDALESIPTLVKKAIEAQASVRFDRCHFHRFGPSSLDFEAVYYINTPDYNAHMDAQQAVHLAIVRSFQSSDIEFAFPTQTLYLMPTPRVGSAIQRSLRSA